MARPKHRKVSREEYEGSMLTEMGDYVDQQRKTNVLDAIKVTVKCKTENQKKFVNELREKEVTICSGLPGTGKAQPLDAKIMTPTGWKFMGEIQVGDQVITQSGKPTSVLGVFPQGEKDIYKITFSDGTSTEACLEHLWLTSSLIERRCASRKTINGKRVVVDRFEKQTVKSTKEIMDSLRYKDGRLNHKVPVNHAVQFEHQSPLVDPYILGFLLGDGSFRGSYPTLHTADTEIKDRIIQFCVAFGVELKEGTKKNDFRIVGEENKLKHKLAELGVWGVRSEDKHIPESYLINSIGVRKALLAGLMDADGTVDYRSGVPIFNTSSERLKNDFLILVRSLGYTATVSNKQGGYKMKCGTKKECLVSYQVSIDTTGENPFRLLRKATLYKSKTKYINQKFIENVELVGRKEAQCIMVADPSHLYLTDDFIVTHNTYLACAVALELLKKDPRFKKIYIIKSVTTLKDEDLGYLKGGVKEKMEPFMFSFMHNFEKIIGTEALTIMLASGFIKELPIAYMRGINIDNAICIIDEAQNITIENFKTIMTRLGTDSKMFFLGDTKQIDMKKKDDSSLEFMIKYFGDLAQIGTVVLGDADVVRNPLIKVIENRFDLAFEDYLKEKENEKDKKKDKK